MSRCVFYLLRHAPTLWNLDKRIQGQWDSELAPAATAQCEALAPRLAGLALARILCSDLGRAKSTAGILNRGLRLPVTLDKRLREQHYGEWTGKHWRDIPPEAIAAAEAAGWNFHPTGGESRAAREWPQDGAKINRRRPGAEPPRLVRGGPRVDGGDRGSAGAVRDADRRRTRDRPPQDCGGTGVFSKRRGVFRRGDPKGGGNNKRKWPPCGCPQ